MKKRSADHTKLPPICTTADHAPVMHKTMATLWRWIADGVILKHCTVHIGTGKHVPLFAERLHAAGLLPQLSGAPLVVAKARGAMLLWAALCLVSCGPAPLGRLNPGAQFSYTIVTDAKMHAAVVGGGLTPRRNAASGLYPSDGPSAFAAWVTSGLCTGNGILELHAGGTRWIAAHECAHAADRLGSMRVAIERLTPPNPNAHMAKRLASMQLVCDEAERRGVCHWRVIRDRWGNEAVVHQDIIDRLDAEGGRL